MKCKHCGSYAINPHLHGRDKTDLDHCDVCYWRKRAGALGKPQKGVWERAPDWARFRAQDQDGSWYWYEKRPVKDVDFWRWDRRTESRCGFSNNGAPNADWQHTLEERPE